LVVPQLAPLAIARAVERQSARRVSAAIAASMAVRAQRW
jgi:hypothetical protein